MKLINKNSVKFGLIISILIPLILFIIAFLIRFQDYGYENVWRISYLRKSLPKIFSLCVFPNGLAFYYYIVKDKTNTMRGMLIGTMIMALIMVVLFALS